MYKRVLMNKSNIFKSIGILFVLSLFVILYSGVKEGYFNIFIFAMIITPMVFLLKSKKNLKGDLIFTIVTVSIITLSTIAFWKYKDGILFGKDHILQLPEEFRGQFSFENELKLNLAFICVSISTLLSFLIRFVYSKLKG